MKLKTWISDQGEVFTGTRAALMRDKEISSKSGFDRPSGALASDCSRWLAEERLQELGEFKKPFLYLGPRQYQCPKTKKRELHGASETAGCYVIALKILERGHALNNMLEWARDFKKETDSKYTVVDNRQFVSPYKRELKELDKQYDYYKKFCNSVVVCCGADYDTVDEDVMTIYHYYKQEIKKILKRKLEIREDTYRLNREHWEKNTVLMQSRK